MSPALREGRGRHPEEDRRGGHRDRAGRQERRPAASVRETADLWFHSMLALAYHGLGPADVLAEMHRREGISGIDEKAARKE